ncbi:MAG TPA: beta-galactosidase, partial [Candidatus Sulfopaludibacter sp.]|nr:beta-galactosidase [Candidatus Sulfopaludibacter sp.]
MRTALILALPLLASAAPPAGGFLPVSVWYAGGKARAPMLEPVTPASAAVWRKDLEQIRSLGFNTVRTWVEWTAGEPRPGEYHLEPLDLLLTLAEETGLKVIVQTYVDSAPDWVGVKFPDGRFVAQNGQAIPSQAAPGFCFDHPGVRQATLAFLQEVARHAARSPAFYGWDLWSEPHIINWAEINYIPNATFCYCPHSLARFREWLQKKYGNLAQLNTAWHRQFEDWSQVEPPRFDTILSYTDYMDWRVFITQKLAADLRARSDTVKALLPDRVTTSHAAGPSALGSLGGGDGNPDDYLMYKAVDYYGTSLYPKHSLPPHMAPMRVRMALDLTRSAGANRGFYIGELQAGFGVRGDVVSQEVTPLDLARYMWTAISRGARALNLYAFYPMNAGYESGGYGLID